MGAVDIAWLPEGWEVEVSDPGGGARGRTLFDQSRILIAPGLHPWQERATYAHEAIHAHRGPVPPHQVAREERRVNRETARRLIPLADLVRALQETQDAHVAAELLEVPVAVVWARLQGLHPAERHTVRRRLDGLLS